MIMMAALTISLHACIHTLQIHLHTRTYTHTNSYVHRVMSTSRGGA